MPLDVVSLELCTPKVFEYPVVVFIYPRLKATGLAVLLAVLLSAQYLLM
jgi:hypothetical protein